MGQGNGNGNADSNDKHKFHLKFRIGLFWKKKNKFWLKLQICLSDFGII